MKSIRAILFSILLVLMFQISAFSEIQDAFDWDYWSTVSGITTGSVNDIQTQYFISQGYSGSLNDMYIAWLIDQTCLDPSSSFNTLLIAYFVDGTSCVATDLVYNLDRTVIKDSSGNQIHHL